MVNFSSLHDEGRPIESFHHYRRDKLLIPRQNGGNMVDFDLFFTFICTFTYYLALYPTLPNPSTVLPKPIMMKRLFKKKGVTKDETPPPAAAAVVGVTPIEVGVAPSSSAVDATTAAALNKEKKLSLKSKEKSSGSSAKHDKEHRKKKKKEHRSKSKKNDGEKQRSKFIRSLYAFLAFIIFGIWKKYIYTKL